MVRVVDDERFEKEIICPNCKKTLRYTEEDEEHIYESYVIYCPNCDVSVETRSFKPFTFPEAFDKVDKNTAVELTNEEIQELINNLVNDMKRNNLENHITGKGNVMIFGMVDDMGAINVFVTKDYYETYG